MYDRSATLLRDDATEVGCASDRQCGGPNRLLQADRPIDRVSNDNLST